MSGTLGQDDVIAADDALLLDTEELGELSRIGHRHEGRLVDLRRLGDADVVGRHVDLPDEAFGGLNALSTGHGEFLGQPPPETYPAAWCNWRRCLTSGNGPSPQPYRRAHQRN